MKFFISDIKQGIDEKMAANANIKEKDLPIIIIFQAKEGADISKYRMDSKITEESLLQFISNYEKGLVKRTVKSEDPPIRNLSEVVITVVGSTFDEYVRDKTKDVVVLFTYPFDDCGDCKRAFDITLEPVAKSFKHNTEIVFAKFNVKDNEIEGVPFVKNPPYIKMFLMNEKDKPIDFKYEYKDYKDYLLADFIMDKSTNPTSRTPKYD